MGNSPVTIGLQTNKVTCQAGETLTGRVYVSVNRQAQPAEAIMLRLIGREHSMVHHTIEETENDDQGEHTYTQDHYDERTNAFFRLEYPLYLFQTQQILPGQYEFPFSIRLPTNLPSSMRCQWGESHCSVEYIVSATLQNPSRGVFSTPKSEQLLTIYSIPPSFDGIEDTSLQLPADEVPVNVCCCFSKGTMALQSQFDKTVVQPRDVINVQFRCENQSNVKVNQVRVQMEQIVEWRGHGGNTARHNKVLHRQEMSAHRFPELETLHFKNRNYFGTVHDYMPFQNDRNSWKDASILVPLDAFDSFDGRLIKIRHLVSVHLMTKGCCTNNPDSTSMVQVYHTLPAHANTAANFASAISPSSFQQEAAIPSAPPAIYDKIGTTSLGTTAQPSAPPSSWDSSGAVNLDVAGASTASIPMSSFNSVNGATNAPIAEATVLPPGWNAQTADIVEIPMAEAILLDAYTSPANKI